MSNRRQNEKRKLRDAAEMSKRLNKAARAALGLPPQPEQPRTAPRKTIRALLEKR